MHPAVAEDGSLLCCVASDTPEKSGSLRAASRETMKPVTGTPLGVGLGSESGWDLGFRVQGWEFRLSGPYDIDPFTTASGVLMPEYLERKSMVC